MSAYEFGFVVEDFDIDDDDSLVVLYENFGDVDAALTAGRTTLEFVVEADGAWEALESTLRRVHEFFPNVRVVRLDRDLVSLADIADRCDRSGESVRLLSLGQRGPGGFPKPDGVLGGGTRVWEWAAVAAWFRTNLGVLAEEPESIDAECAALFDAHLTTHGQSLASQLLRPFEPSGWETLLSHRTHATYVDSGAIHVVARIVRTNAQSSYVVRRLGPPSRSSARSTEQRDDTVPAGVFV